MNNHYQSSHGQEHCYIRLNGSIIRDIGWAENGISSIELGLLGYEEVEVKVICGNFTQTFSTNADLDILTRIPLNFEGEIRIDINPSHSSSKIFLIYCKSILKFRRNDLDNLILQMQRELENTTTSLDLGSWKSKFKQISPVNVLERRYFNGFYEYALGSYLEKNDRYKEAKQHFEDAFGLVAPFKTNLARTASRVLGLKMNCFAFFEGCSQNSPFASADAFFNKALNPDEVSFVRVEPSKLGIFIDRFSHLFLDSLFSFYNKVDQQFPILLDALQRDFLSKEKNNADKLTLLKARYYKYQKQITKADVEYSLLEYHPIFGEEAKLYLQCRTKIQ